MEKLLVCTCAANDSFSDLSTKYLMENHLVDVKAGVEKYANMVGASETMFFLPGCAGECGTLPELGNVKFGIKSPVNENPYAIAQQLVGNLPRPMIQDDFVAVYEGKAVMVLTPEVAYTLATGKQVRFIVVNKGDASEVKEVEIGTKLTDIVDLTDAKAVLLGGLKGKFILPSQAADYTVDSSILYSSITVYGKDACMVVTVADLMNKSWEASCGKCVICREATLQCKTIVDDMPVGKSKAGDIELLKDILPLVKIGSYCPFGQNWPNTILSALELFADEFDAHIKRKTCPAGVCFQAGDLYYVQPDVCTGCGDCIDECDYTAIEGKKKFIAMIDQDMCEHCGKCVDFCDEGAIVKAEGGKLPKLPKKLTKVGKF